MIFTFSFPGDLDISQLDLKFASLVTLFQRYVSHQIRSVYVFPVSRNSKSRDGQTNGRREGLGATLNAAIYLHV